MTEKLTGDYRKYSDKKYLYHWDISDKEDTVVTIDRIERETLENKKKGTTEQKLVLYFKEAGIKPLALNKKENPSRIAKAIGSRLIEDWPGKKIALYVAEETRSEDGLAIRVRNYPPTTDELICQECGAVIKDVTVGDKTYSAKVIANRALTLHDKYLCYECAQKAGEEA